MGLHDLDSKGDVSDNDTDDENSNNDDNIDNVPVVDIDDSANDETLSVLLEETSSTAVEEVRIEEFVQEFNDIVEDARLLVEQAKD